MYPANARFAVLMYHSIAFPENGREKHLSCPPPLFERHMKYLHSSGYSALSLTDIFDRLAQGKEIPEKTVSITLDDGFEDNYEHAYPVLRRYQIPATIFLISGWIGKTNAWMTGHQGVVRRMLTWRQIREMQSGGIEFGAHTVSHPRLSGLDDSAAASEILASKQDLEAGLNREVRHFAYPYGDWNAAVRDQVSKAGFATASGTRPGFNNPATDRFELRRIDIRGTDSMRRFRQKVLFGTNDGGWPLPLRYYGERFFKKIRGRA